MASNHLPDERGIRPDFLERHTIDSSLSRSLREERERREIERRERKQRVREARERELRAQRIGRQEREEQEGTERNSREQRVRLIRGERRPVQESCQHYQGLCTMSFPCCGIFYPCHRCHNESNACEIDDIKAEQATHVKCANCGHEDEIRRPCPICDQTTVL